MKKDWRILMATNPRVFACAMLAGNSISWRVIFDEYGIETGKLPRYLKDFVRDWNTQDFIYFVQLNNISNRTEFEKIYHLVFNVARKMGVLDSSEFLEATNMYSNKKWEDVEFSERWVTKYLLENPQIRTVKSVSPGLREQLRKAGLYPHLTRGIGSRRKTELEK